MASGQPTDMAGLRRLYFDEFVVLYDYLSAKLDHLPSELHFEVTAAFDHIMRAGLVFDGVTYEEDNIRKASGHLKRATFDAFKLLYRDVTRPLWKKLTRARYESVPGFVEKVRDLWYAANKAVETARGLERVPYGNSPDQWSAAFNEWKKLRDITDRLEELSVSDEAKLARRKYERHWFVGIGLFLLSVLIEFFIQHGLEFLFRDVFHWIK